MRFAKLCKVGGSVMFVIPKAIREELGITLNTQVGLSVSDGRLIVEPHPRQPSTRGDLIDQRDPATPMIEGDQDWVEMASADSEGM